MANRWCPEIVQGSIFEAVLGLSLYRIGRIEESLKYLQATQKNLDKVVSQNQQLREFEQEIKSELNKILDTYKVE